MASLIAAEEDMILAESTSAAAPWPRGVTVLYRYGRAGQANTVRVGTVVADDPDDGLTLWVASGSAQIETVLADGRPLRAVPDGGWADLPMRRVRTTWRGPGIVMHTPPDAGWALWWRFHSDGRFAGWYGNLQSPAVRWSQPGGLRGIDTADLTLDVVVAADGTGTWKDEREFRLLTGRPDRWTAEQAETIRADGEWLLAAARDRQPPFDGQLTRFRPEPAWPVPAVLPDGWDRPHTAAP